MDRSFRIDVSEPTRLLVGTSLGDTLSAILHAERPTSLAVVLDVGAGPPAQRLARQLKPSCTVELEGGEGVKTIDVALNLVRRFAEAALDRRSIVVVIGGGSVTDVAGFAASIYLRGLRCVFVPTTLLAMVDAALGGKNGIDFEGVKNVLGLVRQPALVVADLNWVDTLPEERLTGGLVEALKTAAMFDARCFSRLVEIAPQLRARERTALAEVVLATAERKLEVVAADPREGGDRIFLNFGHTVGHAIEAATSHRVSHGDAVAIGMVVESLMLEGSPSDAIVAGLRAIGSSPRWPEGLGLEAVWDLMCRDKKVDAGEVRIAIPRRVGQGSVRRVCREDLHRGAAQARMRP